MSGKHRLLWILPAVSIASWLAVRSLSAEARGSDAQTSPWSLSATEIADPALAQLIGRFADEARTQR